MKMQATSRQTLFKTPVPGCYLIDTVPYTFFDYFGYLMDTVSDTFQSVDLTMTIPNA